MSEIKIAPQPIATEILKPPTEKIPSAGGGEGFGDLLKNAIESVNEMQQEAGEAQDKFARGEAAELHQVMIAAEKAGLSFDLLLEIRQRLVDAYKDIMRMPI
jgi:flagellar hook-basal body complex protein FliE